MNPDLIESSVGALLEHLPGVPLPATFDRPHGGVLVEWASCRQVVSCEISAPGRFQLLAVPAGGPSESLQVHDPQAAAAFCREHLVGL